MSTVAELYDEGRLTEALDAAAAAVRSAPTNARARWVLGELLFAAGDFERADQQFDTLGTLDAKLAPRVLPVRHLIRAATARRDFHEAGALPDFLGEGPTPHMKLLLEAHVHLRAGDAARAAELVAEAGRQRRRLPGSHGDTPFGDFRDADDMLAGVYEVYKAGKYYWIPAEQVSEMDFEAPTAPLDLCVRSVTLSIGHGADAAEHEVSMPVVYATAAESDDLCRMARSTKWVGDSAGPVRGVGQRVFALNDGVDLDILDLQSITFSPPT
jgi:type VI secretion system protein ImpE